MKNTQWQLIETAPKDGTAILVTTVMVPPLTRLLAKEATDECDETNTAVVSWAEEEKNWVSHSFLSAETLNYEIVQLSFEPTHWMPLPEDPWKMF